MKIREEKRVYSNKLALYCTEPSTESSPLGGSLIYEFLFNQHRFIRRPNTKLITINQNLRGVSGMMDIALITANANQLRYIIEFSSNSPTYYLNLVLISVSLLLQVCVGVSLIFKGRMDLRGMSKHPNAKRINIYVVVGIFLVTIINVFIASFTITGSK